MKINKSFNSRDYITANLTGANTSQIKVIMPQVIMFGHIKKFGRVKKKSLKKSVKRHFKWLMVYFSAVKKIAHLKIGAF